MKESREKNFRKVKIYAKSCCTNAQNLYNYYSDLS
jgi:hypothetical protein